MKAISKDPVHDGGAEIRDVGMGIHGFRCDNMLIDGSDVRKMREMFARDPGAFGVWLSQLEYRFNENRVFPAAARQQWQIDAMALMQREDKSCPKCRAVSGDDWSQCNGQCPMPMSPHFNGEKP